MMKMRKKKSPIAAEQFSQVYLLLLALPWTEVLLWLVLPVAVVSGKEVVQHRWICPSLMTYRARSANLLEAAPLPYA